MGIEFEHLRKVLDAYGQRFIELYRANMEQSGRPASGDLANSLHSTVVVDSYAISVDISLLEYWKYIEKGTMPHWTPISPLIRWATFKIDRIMPRPLANGKLPTPTQLAYAVQHKIADSGTEGKPDFARSLDSVWAEFQQAVGDAITADVTGDIDYILHVLASP